MNYDTVVAQHIATEAQRLRVCAIPPRDRRTKGPHQVTREQVAELIEFCKHPMRRGDLLDWTNDHGLTICQVYWWRKKLGLRVNKAMNHPNRPEANVSKESF